MLISVVFVLILIFVFRAASNEGSDESAHMQTFGKESPSYSTVKKWAAVLRGGEKALRMMNGLAAPIGTVQSILTDILGMSKV